MTPQELRAELGRRTKNPHVIERIMRLNPKGVPDGQVPRGWRDGDRRGHLILAGHLVTRGQVIREHGRAVWELIPRRLIQKGGRRMYAAKKDVLNVASDLACMIDRVFP